MEMFSKLLVTWVCLLRDEVKTGDTELGFIITEAGDEARGVVEISQGGRWGVGCVE